MSTNIICLEGCHGVGKTEVCKLLEKNGYNILNEAFLNMKKYSIKPQSLTAEVIWLAEWFKNIYQLKSGTYIADRSPYSAAVYSSSNYNELKVIIKSMILELENINIYIINVNVKPDILWNRIQKRLKKEPERKKYNEDNKKWMFDKLKKYELMNIFDVNVQNNETSIDTLYSKISEYIIDV